MVFAFVLILFGFYWIDKIRERAQTSRTQSRGLRCAPASSCCQFDIPIAIYVRTLYMCAWVWEGWRAWRVRGSRCDSLATPPHAFSYPSPSLPPPLGLCLNICNMLGERAEFEFSGGSMQRVRLCVCVRVYLAPQMRFLCVGWRLAACGCRLMEFRSGIKCDTQKLPIGIHIYSYCQSYAHTERHSYSYSYPQSVAVTVTVEPDTVSASVSVSVCVLWFGLFKC